jgi:hypothetical protein
MEDVIALHIEPDRVKAVETIFNIRTSAISLTVGLQRCADSWIDDKSVYKI